MKKISISSEKLQLKKRKVSALTFPELSSFQGGTGASPCQPTYGTCPPGPNTLDALCTRTGATCGCETATCDPDYTQIPLCSLIQC